MPLYDVEMKLTIRLAARDQGDAEIEAYLTAEEHLYGGVIITTDTNEAVEERAKKTGITLQVTGCERVVTARPFPI